jgi:hypothetical protein
MLALLLAATLSHPVAWPGPTQPLQPLVGIVGDEKAPKALDAWLKLYRSGKIDFRSKDNIAKDSIAMKFGVAPKSGLGHPTWAGDLEAILEALVRLDTAEAALGVLEVAAIGIDQGKYTVEMAPYDVRALAETWAAKFTSAPAKETFAKAARGELKVDKAQQVAMQTAGIHCLVKTKDLAFRQVLEQALGDGDEIVRISAAEGLGALGDDTAALALIALLERDTVDAVLIAAAQSLRSLYSKHLPKSGGTMAPTPAPTPAPAPAGEDTKPGEAPKEGAPKADDKPAEPAAPAPAAAAPVPAELPESVRLAVRAALKALGRTTWRADMALVRLLDDFRSLETVPALVLVLERFKAHPEEVKSGKLSGLLLYQAHELLVAMTGAVYPADQPEKWRELWEKEKDKIQVTTKREPAVAHTVVDTGFCGIPVLGTRVVFVLDLSGSMDFDMDEVGADGKKVRAVRLDFAKRELCRAIDVIAPNAQFNLVTFNGDDKAKAWEKSLVPATQKNRERFKKDVNGLRALGGTNLWSGLEDALKIKSLVYGNHYASNIDELFILSDGAPSVGDVQDPIEILRLVQECNKFSNVRINTIFISSTPREDQRRAEPRMSITPQELMRRMAEQNGGKFKEL